MRCEECGALGIATCVDPEDPWPLCEEHAAALFRRLNEAARGPTYSLDEVLAGMSWRYRSALTVLRFLRRMGMRS